jgi:hypothetical protein
MQDYVYLALGVVCAAAGGELCAVSSGAARR